MAGEVRMNFGAFEDRLREHLSENLDRAGEVVAENARTNASAGRPGLEVVTGGLVGSILPEKIEQLKLEVGANARHAAVHELGGGPTVTPAMRKWAWAMWYAEGKPVNSVYKAIALTTKATLEIPPRPYLRPALLDQTNWLKEALRPMA